MTVEVEVSGRWTKHGDWIAFWLGNQQVAVAHPRSRYWVAETASMIPAMREERFGTLEEALRSIEGHLGVRAPDDMLEADGDDGE